MTRVVGSQTTMTFDLVENLRVCPEIVSELMRGRGVLIYYSHIPVAIISFLMGLFVLLKGRNSIAAKAFFAFTATFSVWTYLDLFAWLSSDSRVIMVSWALLGFFSVSFFVLSLYFVYVFIDKKDISFPKKIILFVLLLPVVVMTPSRANLDGFDADNCMAIDNHFLGYLYVPQAFVTAWMIGLMLRRYRKADRSQKRQIALLAFGIVFFLATFFGSGYFADLYGEYSIEMYGLFAMLFFLGMLGYLIVRYEAFDIRLMAVQALVVTLVTLIGAQFLFIRSDINRILTGITLGLSVLFGWMLISSVKKEVERKDELQEISTSLAVANQRLKELDNTKSEFISIASHQLRTPLTAIKGYLSLVLEESYGRLSPEIRDVMEKMYTVNGHIIQLVEDLLSVSRIETGRVQYRYEPVRLEALVADTVDMFLSIAKSRGLALQIRLPKKALPKLMLDADKIREVLSNLIDNAVKYTDRGGVTVSVGLHDTGARMTVEDTGIGFGQGEGERLFRKFSRSVETMKIVPSGTGLGLYVGKNFVEAHGGRIWGESDGVGRGARFTVELPLRNPNAADKDDNP